MPRVNFLFPFVFTLLLTSSCNEGKNEKTETPHSPLQQKIDDYLQAHYTNGRFNGSLLIGTGDSIIYQKSFGVADREAEIPNSDSTIFLIGSITKPFTAFAILLLEKEGKLSLRDSLSKYFPDFPQGNTVTFNTFLHILQE